MIVPLITVTTKRGVYNDRTASYKDRFGGGFVSVEVFTSDMIETPVVTLYTQTLYGPKLTHIQGNLSDLQKLRNVLTELLEEFGRE